MNTYHKLNDFFAVIIQLVIMVVIVFFGYTIINALWPTATTDGQASTAEIQTSDTCYYLPAEIVATNDTSTYFGCENGQIYYITSDDAWADDVPYLLYMDGMGTDDPTDDAILVIWRDTQ